MTSNQAPSGFQVTEADGPSFTADSADLNASSSWTADSGVQISLDVANRYFTIQEVRKFAQDLTSLIETIEGS